MSVKPIDLKTALLANNNASQLREVHKAQEAGLAENVKQHKDREEHEAHSVQKTEAAEDKVIRKDDEEEEKEAKRQQQQKKRREEKEEEKKKASEAQAPKKHPKLPDGARGYKIDLKI